MILTWKGEKLGEITAPTIKEMRLIKRDLGIRNPLTFLNRAVALVVETPVIGSDGKPVKDDKGNIVTEQEPSEEFDIDALSMLIAIMLTRNGTPTDFEQVDGNIMEDLQIDMSEDEKAQLAEEGKAALVGSVPALPTVPDTTSETSTTAFGPTPLDSGSSTDSPS